jgi:hypothetical protein
MATLITASQLTAMFDIHQDVEATRLTPAIRAGSRRLRSMVGETAYTDALSGSPSNADRKEDLQYAEGCLAMHFSVLGLNTQIRPAGVVKTEKIEGETVVQYLSPGEIASLAQLYLDQAEEIVRIYVAGELPATAEIVETDG